MAESVAEAGLDHDLVRALSRESHILTNASWPLPAAAGAQPAHGCQQQGPRRRQPSRDSKDAPWCQLTEEAIARLY